MVYLYGNKTVIKVSVKEQYELLDINENAEIFTDIFYGLEETMENRAMEYVRENTIEQNLDRPGYNVLIVRLGLRNSDTLYQILRLS